jgi:quercetin dioxygenase-like cupin family protein
MSSWLLRLYVDRVAAKATASLEVANRVIYVWKGSVTLRASGQVATLAENSAWYGPAACEAMGGAHGVTLLRWELTRERSPAGAGLTHEARVDLDAGAHIMRCDRVDFPLGGIAYTHVHQGPGIRLLLSGEIRVEVSGHARTIEPGQAWFETGPDPVIAFASKEQPTSFARCMILPLALRGKSSIRYVKAEDAGKPKTQQYQLFVDEPIAI